MPALRTQQQRVQRGAQLLDATTPGWAKHINLSIFAIGSTCNCVLGQLYGDYIPARDQLFPEDGNWKKSVKKSGQHGFTVIVSEEPDEQGSLQPLWVKQIKKRLA